MPTTSIDVVHMDGRRIRFQRQDDTITVHALGVSGSRTLDVEAARRLFQQLEAHGFAPVDEAAAANGAAVFSGATALPAHLGSVIILVKDLEAQVRFYEQTLGLALRHRSPERAVFRTEGATLELIVAGPEHALAHGRQVVPALHGQQARRLRARLQAPSVALPLAEASPSKASEEPSSAIEQTAIITDPEGNAWLLRQGD